MATTQQYIDQLKIDKQTLVNSLNEKGVEATNDETFTSLAPKVSQIETGGGGETSSVVEEKDINFYDYDGTLLHSYTLQEFTNVTELPPLPTQPGLTCQGWNWTLAKIKAEGKATNVGATYITNDGKTRIYIELDERLEPNLSFSQSPTFPTTVDWGDGSPTEVASGNTVNMQHTYELPGKYVITLEPTGIAPLVLGSGSYGYGILNAKSTTSNENIVYKSSIKKIEFGSNILNVNNIIQNHYNIETITLPSSLTEIGDACFQNYKSLKFIVFPIRSKPTNSSVCSGCSVLKGAVFGETTTTIGTSMFQNCYNVHNITYPKDATRISSTVFSNTLSLKKIEISNSITEIGNNSFSSSGLVEITIPNNVTSIGNGAFQNSISLLKVNFEAQISTLSMNIFNGCSSLSKIKIPKTVTIIQSSALANCYGLKIVDFSKHETIPNLTSINVFSNLPLDCKILVPSTLYDEWIVATNWSNYASRIEGVSQND